MDNKNYFSNLKKTTGFTLVAAFLALSGCGSKGGDNNNQPIAVVPTCVAGSLNCINGQTLGTTTFTAESMDAYGVIRLNWGFVQMNPTQTLNNGYPNAYPQPQIGYGYNTGYNGGLNGGYSGNFGYGYGGTAYGSGYVGGINSYNGPVSVTGQMTISQTLNLGYCQLPAGAYTLTTVAPGMWSGTLVSNVRMQAAGTSGAITLSLIQGQIASSGYLQPGQIASGSSTTGRIFGSLMIESANGYPCQMSIIVQ